MKVLLSFLSVIAVASVTMSSSFAGPIIATPTGLNVGDHFRLVFVTTDTTTSASTGGYDNFVTTEANGATYDGNVISWQAIFSNTTVSASAHIGTTNDAIYLVDGTKVANSDSSSGLWSGSLLHGINLDISSQHISGSSWTGSNSDGSAAPFGWTLGGKNYQHVIGLTDATDSTWASNTADWRTNSYHVYGISSDLVVTTPSTSAPSVPEPSSLALLSFGGVVMAVGVYRRRSRVTT